MLGPIINQKVSAPHQTGRDGFQKELIMSNDGIRKSRRESRRLEHLARNSSSKVVDLPDQIRDAWVMTRLEYDKQLLGLSSAGIGILSSMAALLKPESRIIIICFVFSITAFISCVFLTLSLLKYSADYLEMEANKNQTEQDRLSKLLHRQDLAARWLFALGVFTTGSIGILSLFL